jgi:hypothetical protein
MTGKERLKILHDALLALPVEQFYIHRWKCGTAYCAGGLAGTIPELIAEGMRLAETNHGGGELRSNPWFRDKIDYAALEEFFELTSGETDYIFSPEQYTVVMGLSSRDFKDELPTKEEVCQRIATLLSGDKT